MPDDDPEDNLEDLQIMFFDGEFYYSESEVAWKYGVYNWLVEEWLATCDTKKQLVIGKDKLQQTEELILEIECKALEIQQGFVDVIEEIYH